MPDIFPNWHPAAVHFPIVFGVLISALLMAGRLRPNNALYISGARFLLPLAALSALLAALLGWHAFDTVEHDAAGHLAMLRHREWALSCTAGLLLLALSDVLRRRVKLPVHPVLLPAMLTIAGGFLVTAWLGGEMVYRHGIGVSAAAFARPQAAVIPPPPELISTPDQPPESAPAAPSVVRGEHVHKDGTRHHH